MRNFAKSQLGLKQNSEIWVTLKIRKNLWQISVLFPLKIQVVQKSAEAELPRPETFMFVEFWLKPPGSAECGREKRERFLDDRMVSPKVSVTYPETPGQDCA